MKKGKLLISALIILLLIVLYAIFCNTIIEEGNKNISSDGTIKISVEKLKDFNEFEILSEKNDLFRKKLWESDDKRKGIENKIFHLEKLLNNIGELKKHNEILQYDLYSNVKKFT